MHPIVLGVALLANLFIEYELRGYLQPDSTTLGWNRR